VGSIPTFGIKITPPILEGLLFFQLRSALTGFLVISGNVMLALTLPDFTVWVLTQVPGGAGEYFPASLICARGSQGFVQVFG